MKLKQIMPLAAMSAMTLASVNSHAAGFAIIENSASGMGNAFAGGAAIADDASTIWFNPAGMTRIKDNEMLVAGHIILPNAKFEDTGSTTAVAMGGTTLDPTNTDRTGDGGKNAVVPNFYLINHINEQLVFGLGVSVPFGLGTDYNDDWVGRYHAVKSDVMSLNLNPSIAYKMDNISFGFGISAQYIHVELTSAIDMGTLCVAQESIGTFPAGYCASLGATPQGKDGFADLSADGWSTNWNFGVLYEINDDARVGFSYRSKTDHSVDGKADFSVPGELSFLTSTGSFLDTTLSAEVTLPATTSVSYFQKINDQISVMADYSVMSWSDFTELRIQYDDANASDGLPAQDDSLTTMNWEDSSRISVGMNYTTKDQWVYRVGVAVDQSPIPDAAHRTPRIPGNDRTWLAFGVTHQFDKDRSFSFGYAHLFVDETDINNTFETTSATGVVLEHTLTGKYTASVDILSAQVSWKY